MSKQALFTDMYVSECEWLQDHSNDEMLLVMIGKPKCSSREHSIDEMLLVIVGKPDVVAESIFTHACRICNDYRCVCQ